MEVAFRNPELFLKIDIKDILEPFKKTNIKASSIHFSQFSLSNLDLFSRIFDKTIRIAKSLYCNLIVINPGIGKYGVIKRRIILVSHIHKEQEEILKDIKENIDIIKIFHISNRVKNSIPSNPGISP